MDRMVVMIITLMVVILKMVMLTMVMLMIIMLMMVMLTPEKAICPVVSRPPASSVLLSCSAEKGSVDCPARTVSLTTAIITILLLWIYFRALNKWLGFLPFSISARWWFPISSQFLKNWMTNCPITGRIEKSANILHMIFGVTTHCSGILICNIHNISLLSQMQREEIVFNGNLLVLKNLKNDLPYIQPALE